VAAVAWPCRGGAFTCESNGSTAVMVGPRSERDRSGSALIGGALVMISSSMEVQGPPVRWRWRPPWQGLRRGAVRCRRPPGSTAEGAVSLGFDFSLGGRVAPGSL
jgi:hypothetical protein